MQYFLIVLRFAMGYMLGLVLACLLFLFILIWNQPNENVRTALIYQDVPAKQIAKQLWITFDTEATEGMLRALSDTN
jgi:hypothetical protein